jgi:hypothetical protein
MRCCRSPSELSHARKPDSHTTAAGAVVGPRPSSWSLQYLCMLLKYALKASLLKGMSAAVHLFFVYHSLCGPGSVRLAQDAMS